MGLFSFMDKKYTLPEIEFEISNLQTKIASTKVNHVLHLLLCIPTAGIWIIIWILTTISVSMEKSGYERDLKKLYQEKEKYEKSKSKKIEDLIVYDFIKTTGKFMTYDSTTGIGVIMIQDNKKLDFNISMWDDPEALPEVGLEKLNIYNKEGKLSVMTKGYELGKYEKLIAEESAPSVRYTNDIF